MLLGEISKAVGGVLRGAPETEIVRCASVKKATKGDITYAESGKILEDLAGSTPSAVIVPEGVKTDIPSIEVRNPLLAFVMVMDLIHPPSSPENGIHSSAAIAPDAAVPESCFIGPHVSIGSGSVVGERTSIHASSSIGKNCRIGSDCLLHPGVVLGDGCVIGDRCILHPGVVIGADGFKYVEDEKRGPVKVPHLGIVVLGNDVEIGANSCIDRAMLDETVIGDGVKIDNLVQVGHNTTIGNHTVIAGCSGIAGSCRIGSHVLMGGQVGVADHVSIPDGTVIAAKTGISHSLPERGIYAGPVPQKIQEWRKSQVAYKRGDEILKRLGKLEKKLKGD